MSIVKDKHSFRVKRLIVFCALTAIILTVTTYAWFIGMRTVNVSSFDIEIAVTDSLLLSLDGKKWDTTVSISKEDLEDVSYPGHTNSWGGKGLVPVSSIGEMDSSVSRMKLFEKASLTASSGGYRLMASRVDNYNPGQAEQDGYVVFDLFIRNFSGSNYITELNEADEEAIYLTTDSSVTVGLGGVENTGIENSVRVAFAQIGRVIGTNTNQSTITGITCNPDEDGKPSVVGDVTGICRTAQIWEPNDTKHVQNAINWYDTSCKARTDVDTFTGSCKTIVDGQAYPTYAVRDVIRSSDKVDVYDGFEYNGYGPTIADRNPENPNPSNYLLYPYDYFTDSEKNLKGTDRPAFMYLAPNSITKVRVYVWIEGQDVDNYDFASIGRKISVKFGFTKQRYTEEDVEYTEPDLNQDPRPNIILLGERTVYLTEGDAYTDAGAVATDDEDNAAELSQQIVVTSEVDTETPGTYYIKYNVTDSDGNAAIEVVRTVVVRPAQP